MTDSTTGPRDPDGTNPTADDAPVPDVSGSPDAKRGRDALAVKDHTIPGNAMRRHHHRLLLTLWLPLVAGPLSPLAAQEDAGWPREYQAADGRQVVIYQPQVDTWDDYKVLEAWAAVVIFDATDSTSVPGAVRFAARTQLNMDTRTVLIFDIQVQQARFPAADSATAEALTGIVNAVVPREKTLALDRLLADVERTGVIADARDVDLGMEPPEILVSEVPAILVLVDGEPALQPIASTPLSYVVNTNWDLLFHRSSSEYYLRNEDAWLATDSLGGEWRGGYPLPPGFDQLPSDENWQAVHEHLPGRPVMGSEIPVVFYRTAPTELILLDGPPALVPIPETNLLYVTNTESDLFRHLADNRYYYLVSGRWFWAPDLRGPWAFAGQELPADFADIPADHPRGEVRASVPDTPEADEAVLLAHMPTTATVQRSEAQATVVYNGEPEFRPIEGTDMSYAVNTASDVILIGDTYYLCHQGVWFRSSAAAGPWSVSASVPNAVYTIPPSSPVYHTTYVYVYNSTPDVVYVGYTPGYTGVYVSHGYVVYGTGYYYPPYIYWGPVYPVYYHYPYSYGFSAYYNRYTGTYARGASVYGPYGGIGRGAAYNPSTGTYARGVSAWGPYGGVAWADAYNPRTGTYAATRQSRNAYAQWGSSVVTRGDDWARGGHYMDSRGGVAGFRTSEGAAGVRVRGDQGSRSAVRTREGDLYVGGEGQVFRRDGDGGWSQHGDEGWSKIDRSGDQALAAQERARQPVGNRERVDRSGAAQARPDRVPGDLGGGRRSDVTGQLQRDHRARAQGSQRSNAFRSGRSGRSQLGGRSIRRRR